MYICVKLYRFFIVWAHALGSSRDEFKGGGGGSAADAAEARRAAPLALAPLRSARGHDGRGSSAHCCGPGR
jgi:hypothetical protein